MSARLSCPVVVVDAGAESELDVVAVLFTHRQGELVLGRLRLLAPIQRLAGGLEGPFYQRAPGTLLDQLQARARREPDVTHRRTEKGIELEEVLPEEVH